MLENKIRIKGAVDSVVRQALVTSMILHMLYKTLLEMIRLYAMKSVTNATIN